MNKLPTPGQVVPFKNANESSIGSILLDMGKITPEDAERILRYQKENGLRFGEAAENLKLITKDDIQEVLARQFEYPYLQPGHGHFSKHLVAAYTPYSKQVETLRAVRSQLMLRWLINGRKAFAVAAVDSGDGTSLFAANLATVFSQLGEQTLLVDTNLRTPSQSTIFNLDNRQGLSDVLAGRAGLEVIHKIAPFLNLSVLQAGTLPPNPQELLSRTTYSELAETLNGRYDLVIYDVSAFSTGADALAVAARTSGVLLVVRKNSTKLRALQTFSEQIKQTGATVIGCVVVEH